MGEPHSGQTFPRMFKLLYPQPTHSPAAGRRREYSDQAPIAPEIDRGIQNGQLTMKRSSLCGFRTLGRNSVPQNHFRQSSFTPACHTQTLFP